MSEPTGSRAPASRATRAPLARILARIDEHVMAVMAPERLGAVRVLGGGFAMAYLLARLPHFLGYAWFHPRQFRPVGLAAWLLEHPLPAWAVIAITLVTAALSIAFFLGWRFRVVGPLFAVLFLWTLTYRHCWGMVFHTDNLLALHVLILGLSRSADAWSLDARRKQRSDSPSPPPPHGRYGWPLRIMGWVVVIAYLLAGVAKLKNGGLDWIWGDELRNYIAIDNARKVLLGDIHSPLAAPLLHWDAFFKVLALGTVALEAGAPLALLHRRITAVWVALVIAFHLGVLALMMIAFPYQMLGLAFACFFPVDRPMARIRDRAFHRWPRLRALARGKGGGFARHRPRDRSLPTS